ncbi:glycosyltransferase family 4 protein [Spiribacter vilamensis]|uniref:Glycosyltransferase involved in cell wall biosynthesis n=1 Tax=Spiribacter vilamensis TaxID=531306 RepID=A0A4Q8D162_9GAMM|nr:glycosyltransferase family 4 protein [Spiribacter vilamensis]RZU99096.1 glycosyltransferase involved in cell wall biosynthesis [Spiribacter vilamensis]TVO61907.1 glycosyltransferase family 4 protein [Spiribacter vilamensis]
MKVTLLSKYSRLGASSRLRSLQYLPALETAGIEVTVRPLFDDDYLKTLYAGKGRAISLVARRYAVRARDLRRAVDADLLWVEKEALPYLPHWLEHVLMPRGVPYVVDYDDAVFHNYDLSGRAWVRRLLGRKIDRVMAEATTVICGNDYLAERACGAGARRVEYLPTVVDAERYPFVPRPGNAQPVIGWIGSPSTQQYVTELAPVLERIGKKYDARLVLVGARPDVAERFGDLPVEIVPWSEDTEAEQVASFDVGIMPLLDGPWERGKCGYKLIQYMACGKPVVASPVGVNEKIVHDWACGLLAGSHEQWFEALDHLISDTDQRQRLGRRGRDAIEKHYSMQVQAPHLANMLIQAITETS